MTIETMLLAGFDQQASCKPCRGVCAIKLVEFRSDQIWTPTSMNTSSLWKVPENEFTKEEKVNLLEESSIILRADVWVFRVMIREIPSQAFQRFVDGKGNYGFRSGLLKTR